MKKCSKCDEVKELDEFYIRSDSGKYRNECKYCFNHNRRTKEQQIADNESAKLIEQSLEEKCCNKCQEIKPINNFRFRKSTGKYRPECNNCRNERERLNLELNPERKERARIATKKWNDSYIGREKSRTRIKLRRKNNPLVRLKDKITSNINHALQGRKSKRTEEILGCTIKELKLHLDRTFEENYGMPREWLESFEYHIDHIIPISLTTTEKEVYQLNHYTNLQILLAEDNISKNNKLGWEIEENSKI